LSISFIDPLFVIFCILPGPLFNFLRMVHVIIMQIALSTKKLSLKFFNRSGFFTLFTFSEIFHKKAYNTRG
jgi:hypothetical protein